jgi:hypothetical protein
MLQNKLLNSCLDFNYLIWQYIFPTCYFKIDFYISTIHANYCLFLNKISILKKYKTQKDFIDYNVRKYKIKHNSCFFPPVIFNTFLSNRKEISVPQAKIGVSNLDKIYLKELSSVGKHSILNNYHYIIMAEV